MNFISGNVEIVSYFLIVLLFWLVVTGRIEAVIKTITGPKDKEKSGSTTDEKYPSLDPSNPLPPSDSTTPTNPTRKAV